MRISPSIRFVTALAVALLLALPFGASAQELRVAGAGGVSTVLYGGSISFRTVDSSATLFNLAGSSFWDLSRVSYLGLIPDGNLPVRVVADWNGKENGTLQLESYSRRQRFIVDAGNSEPNFGIFSWHQEGTANANRLMQLNGTDGGDLFIGGQLTTDNSWDLAESFWESESVETGEIVVVDPDRGDAVLRAQREYESTLLGVVSERPAIVLGGGAFSFEALRRAWGDEVAATFKRQRPELETRILSESAGLRQQAERLVSLASYAAYLHPTELGPERLDRHYTEAHQTYERDLFDAVVGRFFSERFAAVALAGRVRVKADASFGVIRPGDPLTSSPVAGVAMKATKAGPILGMALEGLEAGSGRVLVLVDRGWYAGEGQSLAGSNGGREVMGEATAARLAAKDGEIEELRDRLEALEARLGVQAARRPGAAGESEALPASGE